jgi:hypothetical protein
MSYDPLESEETLARFMGEFEAGTYPAERWKHREHVIMACWYLLHLPLHEATPAIRAGIQRYNVAQGGANTTTSGYHETLTVFWIHVLAKALESARGGVLTRIRGVAGEFGSRAGLFREYYSRDIVNDIGARLEFAEPDLKPLPEIL